MGMWAHSSKTRSNLESIVEGHSMSETNIRIFVSTHKPVDLFASEILQPVQVGSALANKRFDWALHDDEGDNISEVNPLYCELTTQYWAWKNVYADYYGFCHYRRYFDFSPERHRENPWGEVMEGYITRESQMKYGLDDASIACAVEGLDVITTEIKDLRKFPGSVGTPLRHYDLADRLKPGDLEHVVAILKEMHPDYVEDADAFLNGHQSCFCNMFIMRRDPFREYCEWLFPILRRFVDETDFSLYSVEALRTPGHLAERLFNIYYLHQMRCGAGWKTKQLQCVHFDHPERHETLAPLSSLHARQSVVPVVLASDDAYVPMLTTTIYSMLNNAAAERHYDVVVLERDISQEHQNRMGRFFSRFENMNLRFVNVGNLVEGYGLTTNNPHISVETYYRFLIQEVLPFYDKVLYLDSDLIVRGDIAELFDTTLGDNLLAAVRDIDFLGNLGYRDGARLRYAKETLGMTDPYSYFQAGVLLLNTSAMRKFHTIEEWLSFASDDRFIYNDQDALNAKCEGRVTYLDSSWNVMIDCAGRIERVFSYAPAKFYQEFLAARKQEKVIHFAGVEKPWSTMGCDRSEDYWEYARETPFYEDLLARLSGGKAKRARVSSPRAIGESNPLRRIVDPFLPYGSKRRDVARAIGIAISGKK